MFRDGSTAVNYQSKWWFFVSIDIMIDVIILGQPFQPVKKMASLNDDNKYTANDICKMIEFLVDNIYVRFGG